MRAVIVDIGLVTAYGQGIEACWAGLLSRVPAISTTTRFATTHFQSAASATITGLTYLENESLVAQMLRPLLADVSSRVPEDTLIMLATTVGEIDLLEKAILQDSCPPDASIPEHLLKKTCTLCRTSAGGLLVSSACASSAVALACAASMIRRGVRDSVLVVACDAVTEFVVAGFSGLMALDRTRARPFDRDREGLTVGEAAGTVLVMREERARDEGRPVVGEIAGWGLTNDANHMTGPSRDGAPLAAAIRNALRMAGKTPADINAICAHGTGTVYNDAMELRAFKAVFADRAVPTFSVKGAVGHTMGAAGLLDAVVALKSITENTVPPTVGTEHVDAAARPWVSTHAVRCERCDAVLSTNSGFGGGNAALVLTRGAGC